MEIKGKKIYLSIPYTGCEEKSFKLTNLVAGKLLLAEALPLSPISHSHPIEEECGEKWPWETWSALDYSFIDWSDEILVINFDDDKVKNSVGVQDEIAYAEKTGKPVRYIEVDGYEIDLSKIK